jgi:hypothetical protein
MFVSAVPGALASAGGTLSAVGASVDAAHLAAAPAIGGVISPAPTDPVSDLTAVAFQVHAAMHAGVMAMGSMWHQLYAATAVVSDGSYGLTEAAGALTML